MLYPMFAMVALTFLIMFWTLYTRVQALRQGALSMRYFRLMQGEAPQAVQKASRHFMNLFEVPLLFYVLCLLSLIKPMNDSWQMPLAWGFVVCRLVQAIIHLSYNNVNHRFAAFAMGNLLLILLWFRAFYFI
jgi:hypothetical protein